MKSNYHTHTKRCRHAGGSAEDYVKAALEYGLDILGFSDHAPFPDQDYGWRMLYDELDDYTAEIDEAAEKYRSDITLYKGLEIEYLPVYDREQSYYRFLLEEKLDYLICGQHMFTASDGELHNVFRLESEELITDYAHACCSAMRSGYFPILAHPDVFSLFQAPWGRIEENASDLIIETALQTGTILEYNSNGRRKGLKEFPDETRFEYPHIRFWEKLRGTGIEVIVGADSHSPDSLYDRPVIESYEFLDSLGLRPVNDIDIIKRSRNNA